MEFQEAEGEVQENNTATSLAESGKDEVCDVENKLSIHESAGAGDMRSEDSERSGDVRSEDSERSADVKGEGEDSGGVKGEDGGGEKGDGSGDVKGEDGGGEKGDESGDVKGESGAGVGVSGESAKSEEEVKLWAAVRANPADFTSWTSLLHTVEQKVREDEE